MEFGEEQNCVPGCVPEVGAIFMSNSATKEECFRRRLLGLPYWQTHFVKQIKAGMLLFLFEFERRELHGVYQARSDGAINIVPNAFSSSGKQFPAQVMFTPLWNCSPLSEDEFSVAIKENYYSAKKFNFGLSEDQVRKLLYLFSLRKLKAQRHFTRHKVARDSQIKFRKAAGDGRSITSNLAKGKHDADSSHGSVTDYFGARLGYGGRAIEDIRFAMSGRVGNELQVDNEFGATISNMYPGLLEPSANTTTYTSNSNILQEDSSVHYQFEPFSTFCRSIEPQALNISRATSSEDAIVRSSLPYDPDASGIDSRNSSSYECNFNPVQNFAPPHNSNAENVFPSSENQFVPYVQPRGTMMCADFSSGLGCRVPMASPNHFENSQRTGMPVLEAAYSESMTTNSSENASHSGFSLPKPSPGPVPFSDSLKGDRMNEDTSYSFSPNQYPSFMFGYGCPEASEDTNDQEMRQGGINGVIVAMLKKGKTQLQGCDCSGDHHDNETLGGMYSDFRKNRKSVFSRLALAPKVHTKEKGSLVDDDEDTMDGSVDEVMSMLQHSHLQWLKMIKSRQLIRGDATNFRKKRQTNYNSKLLEDDFQRISDEVRMDGNPASEEKVDQYAENTSFVNFKRRSELRKSHDGNTKSGSSSGNAESEGFTGGLPKRRKLIRPNFSKNTLPDDNIINLDISQMSVETRGASIGNVAGLSQDLNNRTHSFEQDSSLEACERSNNGIVSGEIECSGNMQELNQNADLDGETPKSERALEEVVASGCHGCKIDIQQIVETENGVLSSNCEIITGQCKTISSN